MTGTSISLPATAPLEHRRACELGRVEYRRVVDALGALGDADWARPTDCTGWTVRDLAGHLGGAMEAAASLRENVRQQVASARRAKRDGVPVVDAMTALQVERMRALSPAALVGRMAALVDPAADGRLRTPAALRSLVRFPVELEGISERWRLGYLVGPILTRDTWMHRIDLARAVGAEPVLDGTHDAAIVADVAVEWARRHGRPVELLLTGPAGGRFTAGDGGPRLELDAVQFCRVLSGRAEPTHELLAQPVPF